MQRIEPTWQAPTWGRPDEQPEHVPPLGDGIPRDGHDPGAEHRARMRAATTAAQEAERRALAQRAAGYRVREAHRAEQELREQALHGGWTPRTLHHGQGALRARKE